MAEGELSSLLKWTSLIGNLLKTVGGEGVGDIVILSSYKFHLTIVNDNLVLVIINPSINVFGARNKITSLWYFRYECNLQSKVPSQPGETQIKIILLVKKITEPLQTHFVL